MGVRRRRVVGFYCEYGEGLRGTCTYIHTESVCALMNSTGIHFISAEVVYIPVVI